MTDRARYIDTLICRVRCPEFLLWNHLALQGSIPTSRNYDGSLRPAEFHSGPITQSPTFTYALALNRAPDAFQTHLATSCHAYAAATQTTNTNTNTAPRFNTITVRIYLPGMKYLDEDGSTEGRTPTQMTWFSWIGGARHTTAKQLRYAEGCDRFGSPFPDDEPEQGSRDYVARKELFDKYKSGEIGYGEYVMALRGLFSGRDPNRRAEGAIEVVLGEDQAEFAAEGMIGKYGWSTVPV